MKPQYFRNVVKIYLKIKILNKCGATRVSPIKELEDSISGKEEVEKQKMPKIFRRSRKKIDGWVTCFSAHRIHFRGSLRNC